MKDERGFRQSLKRMGKKEPVIDGLVQQVVAFEAHLAAQGRPAIEAVGEQDVQDYACSLPRTIVKERMRGLALYLKFAGQVELAKQAGELREAEIATTRQAFKLGGFLGVDRAAVEKLAALGIVDVDDLLASGRTPDARRQLAEQAGVAPEVILELVKLSDLSRLGAVKSVRARLYYDAGLDTPAEFRAWEPEALRAFLVAWVERTAFAGIAPLPKELRNAIATARSLPDVVEY